MNLPFLLKHEWHHLRWILQRGDSTLRLNYPLNQDSVVFDMGGYMGAWTESIVERYQPNVYVFEPYDEYYRIIANKFKKNSKVHVYKFGLSDTDKTIKLSMLDDASGAYKHSEKSVDGQLKDAAAFLKKNKIDHIDLMKLNIEGGEYDLLDNLIATGFASRIDNIQVQFHHFVPDAKARRAKTRAGLAKTHRLTYEFPYLWENWQKK